MLTDRMIQTAKPGDRNRKVSDGVVPGLILFIHPAGPDQAARG